MAQFTPSNVPAEKQYLLNPAGPTPGSVVARSGLGPLSRETALRPAVAFSDAERAQIETSEREPGNLQALDLEISRTTNPAALAVLNQERARLSTPVIPPKPPTWQEVTAMPEIQRLDFDQREAARNQYFLDVVAPTASAEQMTAAKAAFDADTKPSALNRAANALGDVIRSAGVRVFGEIGKPVEVSKPDPALRGTNRFTPIPTTGPEPAMTPVPLVPAIAVSPEGWRAAELARQGINRGLPTGAGVPAKPVTLIPRAEPELPGQRVRELFAQAAQGKADQHKIIDLVGSGFIRGLDNLAVGAKNFVPVVVNSAAEALDRPYLTVTGKPLGRMEPSAPSVFPSMESYPAPRIAQKKWDDLQGVDETAVWLGSHVSEQIPQIAGMLMVGSYPQLANAYLGVMGATSAGQQYAQTEGKGLDPRARLADAWVNGTVEALSEKIPLEVFLRLKKWLKGMPPEAAATALGKVLRASGVVVRVGGAIGTQALVESGQETITQIGQNLSQRYIAGDTSVNWNDNVKEAAAIGAAAGAVMGAPHGLVVATSRRPAAQPQPEVGKPGPLSAEELLGKPTPLGEAPTTIAEMLGKPAADTRETPVAAPAVSHIVTPGGTALAYDKRDDQGRPYRAVVGQFWMSEDKEVFGGPLGYPSRVYPKSVIEPSDRSGPSAPTGPGGPGAAPATGETPAADTKVDEAAHEAATSTANDLAQPSSAQLEVGNYRKGHATIAGLDISIENPVGSKRRPEWPVLKSHYGYIKGVPARAPDKEHVDIFVKSGTPEDYTGSVFVVDQNKQDGRFDEPKVMLGYDTEEAALAAYLENYTKGWESRVRAVTPLTMEQFKARLQDEQAFKKPQGPTEAAATPALAPAPATAPAVKPQAPPAQPQTPAATTAVDARLADDTHRAELQRMAGEAGWAEIGGRMIRRKTGEAAGEEIISRTKWIPQAGWWPGRPDGLNRGQVREAVRKALAGEQLSPKETRTVQYMLDQADLEAKEMQAQPEPTEEFTDAELRGSRVDLLHPDRRGETLELADREATPLPDKWATMTEAEKEADLDAIFGQDSRSETGKGLPAQRAEGRTPTRQDEARPAGERAEAAVKPSPKPALSRTPTPAKAGVSASAALELKGQSEAEIAAEEEKRSATEARKATEDAQAEAKAAADRERDIFTLTGSERTADQATARGQLDLLPPKETTDAEGVRRDAREVQEARDERQGREGEGGANLQREAEARPAAGDTLPRREHGEARDQGITDVGENLWYNRRNFTGKALAWNDVKDLNETLKVKEVVKSKVWPRPDYEQLVEDGLQPFFARFIKQVYDGIGVTPEGKTDADLERYIAVVGRIRNAVFDWAKDNNANREFLEAMAARAKPLAQRGPINITDMMGGRTQDMTGVILDRVWPEGKGKRNLFREGEPMHDIRVIGGRRAAKALQFSLDDAVAAMKDIEKGWPKSQEAWQRQGYRIAEKDNAVRMEAVEQSGDRGTLWVVNIGRRGYESFKTEKAANEYIANLKPWLLLNKREKMISSHDTEAAAQEAAREATKREGGRTDLRGMNIAASEREGPARRGADENVTSQRLMDEFEFRGVNFGREGWINQAERQTYLNHAYDGLLDLAELLNVPSRALSLNGILGIAFGAQGRGGRAAAHFVPGVNEINLTKTKGAGTLAHEWGHALDHHFGVMAGLAKSGQPFLSEVSSRQAEGVRPEIRAAFKSIVDTMSRRPITAAEAEIRKQQGKASAMKRLDSWIASVRADFNVLKLENQQAVFNEFAQLTERLKNGDMGEGSVQSGNKSFSQVVAHIRNLYKDATGRLLALDRVQGLESSASMVKFYANDVEAARNHVPQTVGTEYQTESARADREKGGKRYWATERELFARAFETYVADRLTKVARLNTFLSDADRMAQLKTPEGTFAMPYPRGEDRARVIEAFDKLVGEIKTEETARGVTMLSRRTPTGADSRASAALTILSENDDLFRYPRSEEKGLAEIVSDIDPNLRVIEFNMAQVGGNYGPSVNHVFEIRGAGRDMAEVVQNKKGEVWLNIAQFKEGRGGSAIYAAVGNYAYNNNLVFIGDPHGLSMVGLYRRTEAMLSSALKFGTTRHLEPHQAQLEGNEEQGVKPLPWKAGDDVFNLQSLLQAHYDNVVSGLPEIADIAYNFEHGRFEDPVGKPVTDADFEELANSEGARSAQAGVSTLKRAALASTFLRQGSGKGWRGILGQVLRQSSEQLDPALRRTLYSRSPASAGLSVSGMSAKDAKAVAALFEARFTGIGHINVVEKVMGADVPAALKRDIKELGGERDTAGAWHNGEVYLFAENLRNPEHAAWVILHEGTHHGLRGMWGRALDPLLMKIYLNNKMVRQLAERQRLQNAKLSVVAATEEALANMGADGVPQSVWAQIIAWVRRTLRSTGVKLRLTDADVRDLVARALRFVKQKPDTTHALSGTALHPAWHGTPHDFEEFSLQKIGTGEGAHVYGWGLYFAGRQEVAEYYRDNLTDPQPEIVVHGRHISPTTFRGEGTQAERHTAGRLMNQVILGQHKTEREDFDAALRKIIETAEKNIREFNDDGRYSGLEREIVDIARSWIGKAVDDRKRGRIYKVELAPKEDEYLDWDKPLSEQGEKVRTAISGLFGGKTRATATGRDIYLSLSETMPPFKGEPAMRAASEHLASLGIPGIRYLDQGSRGAGRGTSNYVIFDDRLVKIESKLSRLSTQPAEIPRGRGTPQGGMLDTLVRVPTQLLGIDKLTSWLYDDLLLKMGGKLVPETVKAGVIADYGVPEAVIDRRKLMQSRMSTALRATQRQIDRLMNLTRAESRTAYAWMTQADFAVADRLLAELPPESRAVLQELKTLVSSLGDEAVRLGQLTQEVHERNRLSYLHRSYLSHESDQTKQQRANRSRAIRILGDQYKGRGMVQGVLMQRVANVVPEWWRRKYQAGRADRGMKREKFVRLERRASRGEGVGTIPGVEETGQRGRLLEVQYWPAAETVPARLQSWDRDAGEWEVRDVKGPELVMWRDFTEAERERMGEIDEVKYAVAKTLHKMIHDIEAGRYLEWLANRYARPNGDGLNVVKASESLLHTFKPGEWVQVPDGTIPGTKVARYGKLAGHYLPGPIWNDVRQIMAGRIAPLGDVYATVLKAWKISKALALDTRIPTPTGWTTMGALQPGDTVFDERGQPCKVMQATPTQYNHECYEVELSDGTKIVADAGHLWFTFFHGRPGIRETRDILATLKERTRGDNNHSIPVASALQLPEATLPIPPYSLGLWLGDGDSRVARISVGGGDISEMLELVGADGLAHGALQSDKRNDVVTFQLRRLDAPVKDRRPEGIQVKLRAMGLLGNKHIPAAYLRGSETQRRELLMGLLDSDGHITDRGLCGFATILPALKDGILELLRSLGYKPTAKLYETRCNGVLATPAWKIHFKAYADRPVFKLTRKIARLCQQPLTPQRSQTRQIVAVRAVPSVPVRCILVSSPSHLFLAGEGMVPTHNTALSPAVHLNNIMANVIMADWHDVRARDLVRALAVFIKQNDPENTALYESFEDSGGALGTFVISELQREQLAPLLDELQREIATQEGAGIVNASGVLQAMLAGRFREAIDAASAGMAARTVKKVAGLMMDLYQAEDMVFRLAAFIKAKEEGRSDAEAGKIARESFLDYEINAPWIQMMRGTVFPFVSFTYRAAPMLLETAAHKPWKLLKLALILGGLNALGYALSGGDEDKERKVLPDEKAGKIFGFLSPKLIRMPWNDAHGSPVFLDIRRFIPVGDIFDLGQTHSAIPLLPIAIPGGPLAVMAELIANRSQFTGREIVKDTDEGLETATKVFDHLFKALAPNIVLLPGTYAFKAVSDVGTGKTDAFGREQSLPMAISSAFGVKLAAYPRDVAMRGIKLDYDAKQREIGANIGALKRELIRKGISREEFDLKVAEQIRKRQKIAEEAQKKLAP